MAEVVAFRPINQPAPGSMTNTGGGDDGNGGKRPPHDNTNPGLKGGVSERERLLEAIQNALQERLMKNVLLKTDKLSKGWAREVLQGYEEFPDVFKSKKALKNGVNRQWMGMLSSEKVEHHTQTRNGGLINFGGGANYLPTVLASTQQNAEFHGEHSEPDEPDARCDQCQSRGTNNRFTSCITLPNAFQGACLECAFGNHYEDCSFSSHVPTARQPRSDASHSGHRRNRGSTINSQPPSPAMSDVEGQRTSLPAQGDCQRVDWAREFMVPGAGSRRGQAVVNFNYSANSDRQEALAEMEAAIRRLADEFQEALKASRGYKPDRYQPPRKD